MLSSIGSSTSYITGSQAKPSTGLNAEIARYKKELSNCVNCESAKTDKGKANIQALSQKIATLTAETEKASKSATETQPTSALRADASSLDAYQTSQTNRIAPESDSPMETVGNNLNVFA